MISQNLLIDATGQLKTTCTTLVIAVATFVDLLRLDQYLKTFHHVLLGFVLLAHLPFHFFKQLFKLWNCLSFCSLWLSMASLTSLQFVSIS